MADYELTRYGEEYLETGPARMQKRVERLEARSFEGKRGGRRLPYDSGTYSLNRRLHILEKVRAGVDPIEGSFDFLKEGPRKTRALNAIRKELASMLKANLIREATYQRVVEELGHGETG